MTFNFDKFANDHGITYKEKRSWKQFYCPFCRGSGDYLGYNEDTQALYCWKCGKHSKKELIEKLSVKKWKDILALYYSQNRPKVRNKKTIERLKKFKTPSFFTDLNSFHIKYLKRRNYDIDNLVQRWSVRGSPNLGVWKYRIMIPIAYRGFDVTYTSRDITDRSPERYKACNPKNEVMGIKSLLYGQDFTHEKAVLVEGPFDVWRLGYGAICPFGTNVTDSQFKKLKKFKKLYVLFDWEAETVAEEVAARISAFSDVEIIEINVEDPGALKQKDADLLMKDLGFGL